MAITRDINAEKQALGKYNEMYGGNPDFKDPKQKAQLYALAYPSGLPSDASDLDTNEYNTLTGQGNTANTGGASLGGNIPNNVNTNAPAGSDVNAQNAQQYMDASQQQYNQMGGMSGANNLMGKLQDIIAKKENIYNPNIGESDIYKSLGMVGPGFLAGSQAAQQMQLQAVGRDMDYALSRAQGVMQTQLNESKMNWDKGTYFYNLAAQADQQARTAMVNSVVEAIQNGDPVDDSVFNLLPKEYQQYVPAWKALAEASRKRAQEKTAETTALAGISSPTDIYGTTPSLSTGAVVIPQDIGNQKNQLAYRNNNPGNLRFANQNGAVSGDNGFAKFNSPEEGFSALTNQVKIDQSRGLTLNDFIAKYAPPSENNTNAYQQFMQSSLGVTGDTKISTLDPTKIASAIAQHESGTKIATTTTGTPGGTTKTGGQWYGEGITAVQTAAGKDIKPYVINDYLNTNGGNIPDAIKHFSNLGNAPEYTGDLRNVVDGIASKTKDSSFQNTINQFITRNGTDENAVNGLRTLILNKGLEAVQATNPNAANNIVNDKQAYDLLAQIQKLQTGTNPISGNITKLLMAAGFSGNDAINNAAKLNTFIQQAKERYVVAQQGKGTSAGTQKAYDAMFPDLSKTKTLNKETINAMIDAMNTTVKQDYITGMGINEEQWNNVFEKNPFQQTQANSFIQLQKR